MDIRQPQADLDQVVEALRRIAPADTPRAQHADELLEALEALSRLRDQLTVWEPCLIEGARELGVSWARLAPVLGVTSRQAAERRYLRLRPTEDLALTREQRVQATRDERAGERAVAAWAREHAGELRQIAGQVSALPHLTDSARKRARVLAGELTGDDPSTLIEPLADIQADLVDDHAHLAKEVDRVGRRVGALRRETQRRRGSAAQS